MESQRHEALLNLAFATGPGLWLACPYDTSALPPAVIEEALRTHPLVWDRDPGRPTVAYPGLEAVTKPFDRALPDPPFPVEAVPFGSDGSVRRRAFVTPVRGRRRSGARRGRTTSCWRRARSSRTACGTVAATGTVRVWRHGEVVVCEVRDAGRFDQPLAGRVRPTPDQTSGFGLWLANQVCDLVQIRSFEDGSVVRLHMSVRDAS